MSAALLAMAATVVSSSAHPALAGLPALPTGPATPALTVVAPAVAPVAAARPKRMPPTWMLVVAQVNALALEYSTEDLAPLLKMTPRQLRRHCKKLWPQAGAEVRGAHRQYRLDFAQACVLIYCVSRDGNTLKSSALWDELTAEGTISSSFPEVAGKPGQVEAKITDALKAILADREAREGSSKGISSNRGAVASAVLSAVCPR